MKTNAGPNCFEIAAQIHEPLSERLGEIPYFLLGGIPTAALIEHDTQIDVDSRAIITKEGITLPAVRENGTRRDIDILILTSNGEAIEAAHHKADELIGDELEVSVFGLRSVSYLREYWKRIFTEWTSERIEIAGGDIGLVLGPLRQRLPRELFEPWQLKTEDGDMSVLHPIAHQLNYLTRSVTGLRPKDEEKVFKMASRISSVPELEAEQSRFAEWYGFAIKLGLLPDMTLAEVSPDGIEAMATLGKRALLASLEKHPKLVELGQSGWIQQVLAKVFVKSNGNK